MSINEAFATQESTVVTSGRGLEGTAQLTRIANELVEQTFKAINADFESVKSEFEASKTSHEAMDNLVGMYVQYNDVDADFLLQLDEATIDGMLKSQQSKRSRSKSKTMTVDNYKAMMSGCIAENLIRFVCDKPKQGSGSRRVGGSVEFSDDDLQVLANNQEQLRKELRNVQSKKSIMKSKADFSTDDPRWQALLVAEDQLKSIRVTTGGATRVVEVDTTKGELQTLLADIDTEHLKSADSKELLAKIKELL